MKYDGKFASRWRAKSPDALCAVLPWESQSAGNGFSQVKMHKSLSFIITEFVCKVKCSAIKQIPFYYTCNKKPPCKTAQRLSISEKSGITFCPARSPKSGSCLHPAGQRSKGYSTHRWNLPSRHRQYRQRRSGQR